MKTQPVAAVTDRVSVDKGDDTGQARVVTPQGAHAQVSSESPNSLQVFNNQQQLIFEYDAETGVTRLSIPEGDLELATQQGGIRLNAATEVAIASRHVSVTAEESIGFKVIDLGKQLLRPVGSSFSLLPNKLKAAAQQFDLAADDARVAATRMQYQGEEFSAVVARAVGLFEKVETRARSIWQTTDNLVSRVKEAAQLRAGRVNQQVDGTIQVKSEKAVHKTKKDFKVQAERIHLG